MSRAKDYEVGYGRPPVASQFPKGQSGNPAGRPKGSKGYSDVISAALNERVNVTIKGKRRSITKWEAACTQMANQAAGGDAKAAKLMIELLHQSEARDDARAPGSQASVEEIRALDQLTLNALRETLRGMTAEVLDDPAS